MAVKNTNTEEANESVAEKKPAKRKAFNQSEGISCRSILNGGLYMEGIKSAIPYVWKNYGDVSEVEYRDLVAAIRQKSDYVMEPCFIIDNEAFLDEFPFLKDLYEEQFSDTDIVKILNNPNVNAMVEDIKKLPASAQNTLKSIAASKVANGSIDSVRKIKALDELFGTKLITISELFADNE